MAKNLDSTKRVPVKWIRDCAKSAYQKDTTCYVCGVSADLELHHLQSISLLFGRWVVKNGLQAADILDIREEFIDQHRTEIYEEVFTLCNLHHVKLHSTFGQAPPLESSARQLKWLNKQKDKPLVTITKTSFSKFT